MDTTGRIKDIARDWHTNKLVISLVVDADPSEEVQQLSLLEKLSICIEKYSTKRSLKANAYFHQLVTKIAKASQSGNTEVKNRLIREYGAFEYINGEIPIFLLKAEFAETMLKQEGIHVKIIGREYFDDCDWVHLAMMRGSHTYNTAEMARLIDGTVMEAKQLGIETLPPDEIERMKSLWRPSKKIGTPDNTA